MITLILFFVFGTQVQLSTIQGFDTLKHCNDVGNDSLKSILLKDGKDSGVPKASAYRCLGPVPDAPPPE